jgi:hypothetical protein
VGVVGYARLIIPAKKLITAVREAIYRPRWPRSRLDSYSPPKDHEILGRSHLSGGHLEAGISLGLGPQLGVA